MKKAETNFAGDALLGASVIRGRTDAKIYLAQVSPDDERRLIWSEKRGGRAIPKTFLVFDEKTGEASLGETVADANRESATKTQSAALSKMLDLLTRNPDMEHKDLLNSLSGSSRSKNLLLRQSVLNGLIIKSGKGVKGSPLKYRIADVPIEVAVPKGGEEIVIQSHDSTDPNSNKGTQK